MEYVLRLSGESVEQVRALLQKQPYHEVVKTISMIDQQIHAQNAAMADQAIQSRLKLVNADAAKAQAQE